MEEWLLNSSSRADFQIALWCIQHTISKVANKMADFNILIWWITNIVLLSFTVQITILLITIKCYLKGISITLKITSTITNIWHVSVLQTEIILGINYFKICCFFAKTLLWNSRWRISYILNRLLVF